QWADNQTITNIWLAFQRTERLVLGGVFVQKWGFLPDFRGVFRAFSRCFRQFERFRFERFFPFFGSFLSFFVFFASKSHFFAFQAKRPSAARILLGEKRFMKKESRRLLSS
ncbi:MAG: hypothetical protein IK000_04300, partial [Bacteroidaceae bacterium]|nr:hypothetical protein [Bacteroidaceae bacterium]